MNRTTKHVAAIILAFASCGKPLRADPAPQDAGVADAGAAVIADLDIPEGMPLPRLFDILKQKVPSFDYVVGHGAWEQQTLPRMHLVNVSIDSISGLVGKLFPFSFHIRELTKSGGKEIYLISTTDNIDNVRGDGIVVQVFSLSAAIDRQLNLEGVRGVHGPIGEARKRCMAAVLSLLENELKQNDGFIERPALSVHDETETLIVKGSTLRVPEVEQALKALDAPVDQNQLRRLQSENDALQKQLERQGEALRAARDASDTADKAAKDIEARNARSK